MADNARDGSDPEKRPTDEAALSARLRRLGDQLGQQQPGESSEQHRSRPRADASGYARGFRLSSELVAGVLVGAGIGWALDRLLGISPWGMIVFLLLGFAAGVVNVMRAAGVAPEPNMGAPPEDR
jgi:ATP synthase protein I